MAINARRVGDSILVDNVDVKRLARKLRSLTQDPTWQAPQDMDAALKVAAHLLGYANLHELNEAAGKAPTPLVDPRRLTIDPATGRVGIPSNRIDVDTGRPSKFDVIFAEVVNGLTEYSPSMDRPERVKELQDAVFPRFAGCEASQAVYESMRDAVESEIAKRGWDSPDDEVEVTDEHPKLTPFNGTTTTFNPIFETLTSVGLTAALSELKPSRGDIAFMTSSRQSDRSMLAEMAADRYEGRLFAFNTYPDLTLGFMLEQARKDTAGGLYFIDSPHLQPKSMDASAAFATAIELDRQGKCVVVVQSEEDITRFLALHRRAGAGADAIHQVLNLDTMTLTARPQREPMKPETQTRRRPKP